MPKIGSCLTFTGNYEVYNLLCSEAPAFWLSSLHLCTYFFFQAQLYFPAWVGVSPHHLLQAAKYLMSAQDSKGQIQYVHIVIRRQD